MQATFWLGGAALLLSACCTNKEEPIQQTPRVVVHVSSLELRRTLMATAGQAKCAMISGLLSVSRQLDGSIMGICILPNGKRCSEQSLASGNCGNY